MKTEPAGAAGTYVGQLLLDMTTRCTVIWMCLVSVGFVLPGCFDDEPPEPNHLYDFPPPPEVMKRKAAAKPKLSPQVALLAPRSSVCRDGKLVESVGIDNFDGNFFAILDAGNDCPFSDSESFGSKMPTFSFIDLDLYAGKGQTISVLRFLGRYRIERNPPEPWGDFKTSVTLAVESNGRLLIKTEHGYTVSSLSGT